MRSHGRVRFVLAVAGAAMIASLGLVATSASATSTTPSAAVSLTRQNYVRVSWRLRSSNGSVLMLERSTTGSSFATIMTLKHVRASSSRLDKHPPQAKLWYRACLLSGPCSAAVTIDNSSGANVGTGGKGGGKGGCSGGGTDCSGIANMVALVNADRASKGVAPVHEDPQLDAAALAHAKYLTTLTQSQLQDPKIAHAHAGDEMTQAGYSWSRWGQNIAWGWTSAATVESEFFNETAPNDGHRMNILNRNFKDVGVACVNSFWTQDLAAH